MKIRDQSPKEYMAKVKIQCLDGGAVYGGIDSWDKLMNNLKANCVPQEIFDMDYTRFEEFLELRRKDMAQKIRRYYEELLR